MHATFIYKTKFTVLTLILTTCAVRNPSGMSYSHTALDLLLRKLSIILLYYRQDIKMDKTVECKACEEQETGVYWA